MEILYILIILFIFLGLYNLCITLFKLPKYNSEIKNLFQRKNKSNTGNNYSYLTNQIAKKIKIPKIIKDHLQNKITIAELNSTPELYISNLLNKALIYVIFGILFIPIHILGTFTFFSLAISSIVKGYKNIDDDIKYKIEKIEKEIPKFLDFMTNSFKFNKNVKEALISYEKIAGEYFINNISITIADMNTTGNFENALKRLDTRINSYNFSKVVRAIIQVVRGEENTQYLVNLYRESASAEYERLKLQANKKIDKVGFYSKIMLFCMMAIVFTIIGLMFIKNFAKVGDMY